MSDLYETRVTRLTVLQKGEAIFAEVATDIEIDDEANGEFVKITQKSMRTDCNQSIQITDCEWPHIKDAVETMFREIQIRREK